MRVHVVNGMLGSGKTTLIKHLLGGLIGKERVAVLVNEFGEVGIDGALLAASDEFVTVELASGCICCTLSTDLRKQVHLIADQYGPERLIIEPSGVATVTNVLQVLSSLAFDRLISEVRMTLVVDAARFVDDFTANQLFLESQVTRADVAVINKCDRVDANELRGIRTIIEALNPLADILETTYGRVSLAQIDATTRRAGQEVVRTAAGGPTPAHLPYTSFARTWSRPMLKERIVLLFREFPAGTLGNIIRAKAIVGQKGDWWRVDYVPPDVRTERLEGEFLDNRVMVIGTDLKREDLMQAIQNCVTENRPTETNRRDDGR